MVGRSGWRYHVATFADRTRLAPRPGAPLRRQWRIPVEKGRLQVYPTNLKEVQNRYRTVC